MSTESASAVARKRRVPFVVRVTLAYALLSLILGLVGARVWQSTYQSASDNDWVAHTYKVEGAINGVLAQLGALETEAIGYAASGDGPRLVRFNQGLPLLDAGLKQLRDDVTDNAPQEQRALALSLAAKEQRDLAALAVAGRETSGRASGELAQLDLSHVRELAQAMLAEEDRLLVLRREAADSAENWTRALLGFAGAVGFVVLALTYWQVRESHLRSQRSRANLRTSNVKLFEALESANTLTDSMTRLGQFGEMLQSCHSLDEVRAGIGGAFGELLPELGGRLALITPSQNLAAIGAHWGRHALIAESVFAPEDCWALRRGQPYPLAGNTAGFVCKHVHLPNPDAPEAGYLCVPLAAQGEVIGVLTFDAPRAPLATERRIALAAGEQLALALANLRLQETLRTQSIRDPLTGLFNRRYLEVSIERELLRAARRALPLAVLMLDVDHFKRFNDSYGHEAGDALLAQFAETVRNTVRSEDIACRYGGEEFTVVLLEADAASALQRADAIRTAVADMSVAHHGQQLAHVTVSIGVAVYPRDGRERDELLRRADAAMYAAKKAGRNRVIAADALGTGAALGATP